MMLLRLKFAVFVGCIFILGYASHAGALEVSSHTDTTNQTTEYVQLTDCIDKNLGYQIKCSPSWDLDVSSDSITLLIDDFPGRIVTATITKSTESGLSLSDLTPGTLQNFYSYADNFLMAKTKIGKKRAVRVVAHPRKYPDVKFLDYFFIKDSYLYRVNFSVNSKEYYQNYEPLFEELVRSFKFHNLHSSALTLKKQFQNSK